MRTLAYCKVDKSMRPWRKLRKSFIVFGEIGSGGFPLIGSANARFNSLLGVLLIKVSEDVGKIASVLY